MGCDLVGRELVSGIEGDDLLGGVQGRGLIRRGVLSFKRGVLIPASLGEERKHAQELYQR